MVIGMGVGKWLIERIAEHVEDKTGIPFDEFLDRGLHLTGNDEDDGDGGSGKCPVCGGKSGYSTNSMETYLCDTCGALFNMSPFGADLITTDARERFPEYGALYDVVAWGGTIVPVRSRLGEP